MTTMWSPRTADELLNAIANDTLPHESAAFEVKAQLPASGASQDIAVDVAAMATAGGIIVYGVLEDKKAVTFGATPIQLAGVKDRISDVVSASVRERVEFDVRPLPLANDPTRSFVVVDVPASPRAPHMVESKGKFRFYGRVPGGNALLTEAQIAMLYDRRREVERESEHALDQAIVEAAALLLPGPRGDLHLVARPLLSDRGLRSQARTRDEGVELAEAIIEAHKSILINPPWDPNFADITHGGQGVATLDGFAIVNPAIVHRTKGSNGGYLGLRCLTTGRADISTPRWPESAKTLGTTNFAIMLWHSLRLTSFSWSGDSSTLANTTAQ